jgi:cytochrome c-type biogenesis protein
VTDPPGGVGILAAVAAGALSFLSPCVLPLVPGYLSAVVGVAPADLERAGARRVLPPSLAFVASFSVIFILLGLTDTGVGSMLRAHHALLAKVAAAVIVALGVLFVASAVVDRLNRDWQVDALLRRAGRGGPVVAGAAFAIAWTPCVGPTLGAILGAAALTESVGHAAVLLVSFPVVIATGGAVLIAMGVLLWTDELFRLNIEAQHVLDSLGLNFFNSV